MNHSYAEQVNVTCHGCGNTFSTEVWVLVDVAERPDLIERLRADSLHVVDCPHCGHRGAMNAPLLLYGAMIIVSAIAAPRGITRGTA